MMAAMKFIPCVYPTSLSYTAYAFNKLCRDLCPGPSITRNDSCDGKVRCMSLMMRFSNESEISVDKRSWQIPGLATISSRPPEISCHKLPRNSAGCPASLLQRKRSIKDAGHPAEFRGNLRKLISGDGHPAEFRGNLWQLISGGRELMVANPGIYQLLLSTEISDSLENLIMKNIHRTLPSQELFQVMDGPGQRSLHNLLKAYAVYDSDVGYTQGMNFIAAIILLHMGKEEGFWVMVALLKGTVNMPIWGLYLEGLALLQDYLNEFQVLVNKQLPELGRHFEEQMITPYMYASGWFMTLFSAYLPFPFTVRIWDVLLSEGVQKTLFRVGLALLRYFEDYVLNLPFEELLQFLLHLPEESLDLDLLLPIVQVVTYKKHNYWEERRLAWRSIQSSISSKV